MSDKIAEIRKRSAFADENKSVISPTGFSWTIPGWQAHNDRAWLLAEVERLRAEIERLIRLNKLLERNEREFLAAIGLATTTVLGPGHDPSTALSSMRLVLAEVEKHRAQIERLREVIRTIRARCVELDDSDAVSETLDIATAVLEDEP